MKKLIYILALSLIAYNCSKDDDIRDLSLYTYIPDDNFERLLIDKGHDDKMDNYVLTANIRNVERLSAFIAVAYELNPDGYGISNFTGLEDFTNLKHLDCRNNNLASLDISKNTALTSKATSAVYHHGRNGCKAHGFDST